MNAFSLVIKDNQYILKGFFDDGKGGEDKLIGVVVRDKKINRAFIRDREYINNLPFRIGQAVIDMLNSELKEMLPLIKSTTIEATDEDEYRGKYGVFFLRFFLTYYTKETDECANRILSRLYKELTIIKNLDFNGTIEHNKKLNRFLKKVSKNIKFYYSINNNKLETTYISKEFLTFFAFDLAQVIQNNISIKQCQNCNKYFIPVSRSDEIYCNNIFKNTKTCKKLGYEIKLGNDIFKSAYRTAYKTQNARVARNKHIPDYKEIHLEPWVLAAKQKMKEYEQVNDIDGFKKWLEENRDIY